MLAAYRLRTFAAMLVASPALGACASAAGPDPVAAPEMVAASAAEDPERPRFFVQWKSDLPGLTRRPSIAKETAPPDYPNSAVRNKEEGSVTLDTCVTADGHLVDISVASSSGSVTLDQATLEWARTAKYLPAEINGEAFAVCGYRFDYVWQVSEQR